MNKPNTERIYLEVTYNEGGDRESKKFDSANEADEYFYSLPDSLEAKLMVRFGWNGDSQLLLEVKHYEKN